MYAVKAIPPCAWELMPDAGSSLLNIENFTKLTAQIGMIVIVDLYVISAYVLQKFKCFVCNLATR